MTRVVLADDHKIVRDGLKRILAATAELEVAGEAGDGDELLRLVKAGDYDVAVVDMSMPGLAGIALIKRLKEEKPKLRILVLSMHGEHQYAARALKAGASGYLNKDSAAEMLVSAIRKIAAGGQPLAKLKAILRVGQVTGVGVIAECVEEPTVLAALKALGTPYVQGFGVRKPEPLDALFKG